MSLTGAVIYIGKRKVIRAGVILCERAHLCRTRPGGCRFRSERSEVIVGSAAMLGACAKSDEGVWRLFPVYGALFSFTPNVKMYSCSQF